MVVLIIILMIVTFITIDVLIRVISQKIRESKTTKERKDALDIGLKLDFTEEAKSLKRVEVENPKARILAVDDETIVLDSFRKILVLAGYSIETVETGKEAMGLIRKNDYDFVFTDLKMPEMDGVEVTKAVKHLRPDIDVIMITGYATIESAVETMKFGAMDYVQKPFSQDELVDFVNKSLIRRQDKIDKQIRPKIHLVTPYSGEEKSKHVFNVPSGIFISPEHTWVSIEMNGEVRIGIDDFVQKTIGKIDEIVLPKVSKKIRRGEPLFSIKQNSKILTFPSPVSGNISKINQDLGNHAKLINVKPYEGGWVCSIEAKNLMEDLQRLRIGESAVAWYQMEIDKLKDMVNRFNSQKSKADAHGRGPKKNDIYILENMDFEVWEEFSKSFLHSYKKVGAVS